MNDTYTRQGGQLSWIKLHDMIINIIFYCIATICKTIQSDILQCGNVDMWTYYKPTTNLKAIQFSNLTNLSIVLRFLAERIHGQRVLSILDHVSLYYVHRKIERWMVFTLVKVASYHESSYTIWSLILYFIVLQQFAKLLSWTVRLCGQCGHTTSLLQIWGAYNSAIQQT